MKIGDRVTIHYSNYEGLEAQILSENMGYSEKTWNVRFENGNVNTFYERNLTLIKNNNKKMNIKDSFTLAFKQEPEKSFRKTGITNGDDFLTEDGQKVFLSWLLKKNGADFKKEVVDDLLKEIEKDNK